MTQGVALVTGGGKGIGAAICRRLGKAGYFVYLNCRQNNEEAKTVLAEIVSNGGAGRIIEYDVRKQDSITRGLESFTHSKLDLLVNNAGILKDNLLYNVSDIDWNDVMETNFFGAVNMFAMVREKMAQAQCPVVISMGSISGVRPRIGQGAYAVSKSMIIEWMRQLAASSENKGISFYAISPGPVATNLIRAIPWYNDPRAVKRIPLGRFAETDEIAEIVLFLANHAGVLENGSNIIADGGFLQTVKD